MGRRRQRGVIMSVKQTDNVIFRSLECASSTTYWGVRVQCDGNAISCWEEEKVKANHHLLNHTLYIYVACSGVPSSEFNYDCDQSQRFRS